MRTRVWTASAVAMGLALAACGSDGDDKTAEPTPAPSATATPVPMGSPSPAANTNEEAASPFVSLAAPESVAGGYKLVWSDEFTGAALGPDWVARNVRAANRACSPPSPDQTTVSDGSAHLQVSRDPSKVPNVTKACPDGQFLNAMIGTDTSQKFLRGIFAARIKFPAVQGAHGSFWLQPLPEPGYNPKDPAQAGVEIDVAEYFGKGFDQSSLTNFIHFRPVGEKPLRSGGYVKNMEEVFGDELPSDDYHVYSVEWTAKEYVFRIDGIETFRTSKAVSNVPEYFILSLLSSDYEIPKITDDVLPLTMSVDWVRAWQK
ncbi:MAG TPA: glycoside hydrolase family 16 protein [Amycolatopsis sp.]|nr:glycoside hydrolase family 16 protein [Amycolatopsis sp.]